MVQPFLPNEADAFNANQAEPDSVDFEILLLGYQRTGVISGCVVSEDPSTPDMTVDVTVGVVALAGSQIAVSVQLNNTVTAADGTNPRIDLVTVNSSGTVVVTAGTAAAQPVAPAIPATSIPLAFLYVPTSDTSIADNQINDKRILLDSQPDVGIAYVALTGDDDNDGLSWQTAKLTIAGAQAMAGAESIIYVGQGSFDIDASIVLTDGQFIIGVNPHTTFGTVLQATVTLGTDPVLTNTTGNLTSGGLINIQMRGTNDGAGGVGMLVTNAAVGDGYFLDKVRFQNFTSHGLHFDLTGGELAGNPMLWGDLTLGSNGAGGTGDGFRLERPSSGIVTFRAISGDDNADSLLHIEIVNSQSHVRIDNLKAERQTDGAHDDIVTVDTSNGGALSIGSFRLFHNVSGGTNANALIRETGGTSLRFNVEHVFITEAGSNTYTYGYDNGTDQIPIAAFVRHPWIWNPGGLGLKFGPRLGGINENPEGSGASAAPAGSLLLRSTGALGTSLYYKASGTGNTGWRPVDTGAKEEAGAVTLDWEDAVVNMESTGGTRVVTLPDNTAFDGKSYLIRRDGSNTVTIDRAGSDTFDDADIQKTLDSDSAAIGIFSIGDGEWKIVATEGTVGGS